jgi:hypothetical protein
MESEKIAKFHDITSLLSGYSIAECEATDTPSGEARRGQPSLLFVRRFFAHTASGGGFFRHSREGGNPGAFSLPNLPNNAKFELFLLFS